ncbi:MAG: hypothetical protein Q9M40_05800 [Sulfurimonas sp.]|nr:hypothetical protein [Sulfurimonas sp.]
MAEILRALSYRFCSWSDGVCLYWLTRSLFSAIFTSRGTAKLVPFSLVGGFLTVLALQPYTFGINIGFAWQISFATLIAFAIMQVDKKG